MQSCEFAVSISTLACCIAEGKSPEELVLISSVLMQLGDTLATIAAHQALSGPKEKETYTPGPNPENGRFSPAPRPDPSGFQAAAGRSRPILSRSGNRQPSVSCRSTQPTGLWLIRPPTHF